MLTASSAEEEDPYTSTKMGFSGYDSKLHLVMRLHFICGDLKSAENLFIVITPMSTLAWWSSTCRFLSMGQMDMFKNEYSI